MWTDFKNSSVCRSRRFPSGRIASKRLHDEEFDIAVTSRTSNIDNANTVSPETLARLAAAGLDPDRMPKHVAIIMDGNGRWANQRGLERVEGHLRGVQSVRSTI